MSDTQITLEFLANTDALKAATQQMQLLGNISKEQYAQFIKLGAENEKMLKQQAAAQQALGTSFKSSINEAKAFAEQFRQLNNLIVSQSLLQFNTDFKQVVAQLSNGSARFNDISATLQRIVDVLEILRNKTDDLGQANHSLNDSYAKISTAVEVLNKIHETSTNIFGKEGLAVNSLAVAQSAYTAVVGQSTGALKLFRQALAVTGIGAAVLLVYELATNWLNLGSAADTAADSLDKVLVAQQQTISVTTKANESVAREISYAEILRNAINDQNLPRRERIKALVEYNKSAETGNRIAITEIDNYKKVNEQISRQIDLLQAMAFVKAAQQVLSQKIEEQLALELKSRVANDAYQKEKAKEFENSAKGLAGDYDMTKRISDLKKSTHESSKQISSQEIANKQSEIEIVKSLIKVYQEQYKSLLINTAAVVSTTKTNFNEENARSFAAANQKWIAEQKEGIQELIDAGEERRLHLQQGSNEEVAAYKNVIELKKQMAELDYGFTQPEKLKLTLTQLEDEYQTYYGNVLQGRMQSNQKGLDELKLNHDLQLKLQQDFGLTQQQVDDDYAASGFATFKEYEEKKRAELQNTADKMAENQKLLAQAESAIQQFMFDSIQQLSDAAFDNMKEARDQQLNTTLESMEKQKQLELSNKNLTEQQKKDIEDKYRRMEAEAKKKAWKADQQAKAEQALINGFLAFTMSLAQQGVPAGLITGAIALATAGVQAGIILSKPVPQFAKGGKNIPAGMKLVGEQGPELLWTPGGETVIPHGDTAKILQAWSIPVPHVNPALKTDMAIAAALPAGIDYTKLAAVLAQELRNNPSVNISMDNAGFAMHLLQKNKNVQLLNNRYSA